MERLTGKIFFISDLHLGASYIPDPRKHEQTVVSFLESIAGEAEKLFLVGDILDYWYEYRTVVPRGFIRFFGALANLADKGVEIIWLTGNHDIWLFDYLRDEIGLKVVDGEVVTELMGHRFYIAHGDACGPSKPSFRFMRSLFRNKFCQKLYSAIHPRWSVAFAHSWSAHSRQSGGYTLAHTSEIINDPYVVFARSYNQSHPECSAEYFVFGHRHILFDYIDKENNNSEIIILGDWISQMTYGVFDGEKFEILRFLVSN